MNKNIVLIIDYKGFFGSKQKTLIYRGGMDISKIIKLFEDKEYELKVMEFSAIEYGYLQQKNPYILYTSSEDNRGLYKSYIEDIVYDLEQRGFQLIPNYACLKAHNNKVAMELLRSRFGFDKIQSIQSNTYGCYEELLQEHIDKFPLVVKTASGAMSRGVAKAENKKELLKVAKALSISFDMKHDFKEILRKVKYRHAYRKESFNRSKFITQNLIAGLANDYKVLVYGNKAYVLYRGNRKNDFRASGSGKFNFVEDLPQGMLDYAYSIKEFFKVPHISLDIGFDGTNFHLIEFQFIYFGTTTLEKSPHYFLWDKDKKIWSIIKETSDLEEVYVHSIIDYIEQ
jgi:glutathione synthase/RimK-type ligase-like ATP-grasp enzyme